MGAAKIDGLDEQTSEGRGRKLIDNQPEEKVKEANDRKHVDDKESQEAAPTGQAVQPTDKGGEETRKAYGGMDGILGGSSSAETDEAASGAQSDTGEKATRKAE